ncbi:MAG: LuxR C-terminal-related transcriptional regulator [Alphaproteobacteria bacterium]
MSNITKRQFEVLSLVAQGMANKEIANSLHISESTVKLHMHGLFKNLNVNNRTQALIAAQESHILKKEEPDILYKLV